MQGRQVELEEPQLALRGCGPHLLFDLCHRRARACFTPAGEVDRRAARVELLCSVEADTRAECRWGGVWGVWRTRKLDSLLCSGDDDGFTRQVWYVAHWVVGHGRVRTHDNYDEMGSPRVCVRLAPNQGQKKGL